MLGAKQKILLIGAAGYDATNDTHSLRSVGWDTKKIPDPRDFDQVVISLLDLDPSNVDWRPFHHLLNPKATRDILFNGGSIVVIGDPRFSVPPLDDNGIPGLTFPFLDWTGVEFHWDEQKGDTMTFSGEDRHKRYREYASRLKGWEYSLASCNLHTRGNKSTRSKDEGYEALAVDGWVANRYKHQVAFDVVLAFGADEYSFHFQRSQFVPKKSGRIVFLPPTSAPQEEILQIVLRDICGFDACVKQPDWVLSFQAPGQAVVDQKIESCREQVTLLQVEIEKLSAARIASRECLKLLYERELELEPAVRKVLAILGATVEEPIVKNKEDGWITVNVSGSVFEGVLEIKSTKKEHFTEDGRKQVVDWVQKGISERGKKYKGIFIGNSSVDVPLHERALPFPQTWAKAAQLSEIVAFTTAQLFQAYQLDFEGKLDRDLFWKTVFECNGVCTFEGIL